ncbi:DUF418 domain-containing protein [Bacillus timonensis]|nr:DUF418 domain-containing protein [Bacillus timonensis]
MDTFKPISQADRLVHIDIIRGLAILGIFIVNMTSFHAPMLYILPELQWSNEVDRWTNTLIDIFAQASFYTLFSFLFGFGMVVLYERAVEKGISFPLLYAKRLLVLLLIGCIHAFLIWHGDILISYALLGFILLLFYKLRAKTLLIWAFSLFIPTLLFSLLLLIAAFFNAEAMTFPTSQELVAKSTEIYSSGSYIEITKQRIEDWYYVNNLINIPFLFLSLLPMFLLGAYFAKRKFFHQVDFYLSTIKKWWLFSFIIAVVFKLFPYYTSENLATEYIQDAFGGPASALFYATSIVLVTRKKIFEKLLQPLSYVGRMSLTNYLLQSIICTLIFYSYGLGFYGEIRLVHGILLTIGIFVIQVGVSKWWLAKYQFGPIEWIWRTLTYGEKQTLRKKTIRS